VSLPDSEIEEKEMRDGIDMDLLRRLVGQLERFTPDRIRELRTVAVFAACYTQLRWPDEMEEALGALEHDIRSVAEGEAVATLPGEGQA
jgi:hypothetical protein